MWWCFGRRTGFTCSYGNWDLFNRLPTRINPSSMKGVIGALIGAELLESSNSQLFYTLLVVARPF